MSNLVKQLALVMKGGRVSRFHGHATLKPETNAEHQFLVSWLYALGCAATKTQLRTEALLACLQHDLAECVVGDIPAPTKRQLNRNAIDAMESAVLTAHHMPDYCEELSHEEGVLLKICDNLAGWLKCIYERKLGNQLLRGVEFTYASWLTGTAEPYAKFVTEIMSAAETSDALERTYGSK